MVNEKNSSISPDIPLCVDLDGTIIQEDSTRVLAITYFKKEYLHRFKGVLTLALIVFWPFAAYGFKAMPLLQYTPISGGLPPIFLFCVLFALALYGLNKENCTLLWLAKSSKTRAQFKSILAQKIPLKKTMFTFIEPVLHFLDHQKQQGRTLVLVTGTDQKVAEFMAETLQLFDEVKGSTGSINLIGSHKAAWLSQRFGDKKFDYVGDSLQDLAVWPLARTAYYVHNSHHKKILETLNRMGQDVHILKTN